MIKNQKKDLHRVLITTPIKETWPDTKIKVIFLGKWCRTYSNKNIFKNYDHKICDYHWDNNQKFNLDYERIDKIYEDLLDLLSINLNKIHKVNYKKSYWRVIIGPWLGMFCQIIFDRWFSIKEAHANYKINKTIFLNTDYEHQISNDFNDFITKSICSDLWNHLIYKEIIKLLNLPYEVIKKDLKNPHTSKRNNPIIPVLKFKLYINKFLKSLLNFGSKNDKHFIISSCLTPFREIILQIKLGQFPRLWNKLKLPSFDIDLTKREQLIPLESSFINYELNEYRDILLKLIPIFIPRSYLEGYKYITSNKVTRHWPKSPKNIFTSGSIIADDIFKAWTAHNLDRGTKLFLGQHGGHYETSKISFLEDHQKKISQKFFEWGAIENNKNKLDKKVSNIGLFISNFHNLKIKSKKNGNLLILKNIIPRYSYWMWSSLKNAGHWESYFQFNCEFVKSLPERIRKKTEIRIYPKADYGYEQVRRWKDEIKDIKIDFARRTLQSKLKETKICISTSNTTTPLITMAINFPTMIIWEDNFWEIREEAVVFFNELQKVGILHTNLKNAKTHISEIWENVDDWWFNEDTQKCRVKFCNQFAKIEKNDINLLAKILS